MERVGDTLFLLYLLYHCDIELNRKLNYVTSFW